MALVRKRDLVYIFLRSFVVQGSWNFRKMLALGFCYSILPICKRLYPGDKVGEAKFIKRHLEFFNVHPYFLLISASFRFLRYYVLVIMM